MRPLLAALAEPDAQGRYAEPDADRAQRAPRCRCTPSTRASSAPSTSATRSTASAWRILLLAALGLAITFGLMGVINMAHGELLMIGAYATYVVQSVFRHYFPAHSTGT